MTSSIEAAVYLDRSDGIFRVGEKVAGVVELTCAKAIRHEGFELLAEGIVHLQAAARNISVFESQNGSTKPIRIFQAAITLLSPGKIPVGFSRYPFEFELSAQNQIYGKLLETYHGVYISIRYEIICQVVLGGWRKNVEANVEFVVHCPTATPGAGITPKPVQFTLTPQSLVNVRTTSRIPDFLIRGRLDKDLQNLAEPITGEITVERCDCPVLSIELQLIRVETCCKD